MAQHIASVATSGLPLVAETQFWPLMQPGDLVFCWGDELISKGIEKFTGGPSHVLKAWTFPGGPWLTAEAEEGHGFRFGQFADYMAYPGDIVLCRRPLSIEQVTREIAFAATLLDYKYANIEFPELVAQRFLNRFPLAMPKDEVVCSGSQQVLAAVSVPFGMPDVPWATPEQLFTDPSVTAICGRLKGA